MATQRLDFGLTSTPAACCGGDDYTCDLPAFAAESVLTELNVDGMTCAHCVTAVTEQLTALDGVDEVSVALVPGATSRVIVRGSAPVPRDAAQTAISEAGYTLVG